MDNKMQLFIKGNNSHVATIEDSATVADLKRTVSELEGIAAEQLILSFSDQLLDDDSAVLVRYGIANLSTVEACTGLLGGKVHGSLARAGKVKGQTPKVEKKEKKRHRTGRAKRRMQYNRRFVNVVATPGRRRGPNANVQ